MNLPITIAPLRANLVSDNQNAAAENWFLSLSTAPATVSAGLLEDDDEDEQIVLTAILE